jgi:hypothetical protein
MIKGNKEKGWREFRATLDIDPWGRPYRAVMSRVTERVSADDIHPNKIRGIIDNLFQMKPKKHINRSSNMMSREKMTPAVFGSVLRI